MFTNMWLEYMTQPNQNVSNIMSSWVGFALEIGRMIKERREENISYMNVLLELTSQAQHYDDFIYPKVTYFPNIVDVNSLYSILISLFLGIMDH